MENTIEEVNKKYERYTFLNQKFNEYMKKSYKIQKIFDLKEKQKLHDELWDEYGNLVEEYLDLDKFFTELNKQVNKMDNAIEQIKSLVNELNLQNTPLMEKPSEYELKYVRTNIDKGKYIKTYTPSYGDPTYWCYPKHVEKKIEDDKTYKVWFNYRDAADPCDSTTWYHVKYIEEVPDDKIELIKYLEKLLKELK